MPRVSKNLSSRAVNPPVSANKKRARAHSSSSRSRAFVRQTRSSKPAPSTASESVRRTKSVSPPRKYGRSSSSARKPALSAVSSSSKRKSASRFRLLMQLLAIHCVSHSDKPVVLVNRDEQPRSDIESLMVQPSTIVGAVVVSDVNKETEAAVAVRWYPVPHAAMGGPGTVAFDLSSAGIVSHPMAGLRADNIEQPDLKSDSPAVHPVCLNLSCSGLGCSAPDDCLLYSSSWRPSLWCYRSGP